MSYYGGTVTVEGRNLITSLIAGETIEVTRILVGSGEMPDDTEPIDMTELVNPIAEATSTTPVVEDGVLSMTVQYRNDLNGGLEESFWLREFGIFAKTEDTDEILLYYATLGDSPQPVNAYQDNRIDIRNYPISISLLIDADVEISYTAGSYITAEDAETIVSSLVTTAVNSSIGELIQNVSGLEVIDFTISTGAWTLDESATDKYVYYADVTNDTISAEQYPLVTYDRTSQGIVTDCGMCGVVETFDGYIRFYAQQIATDTITGVCELFTAGGDISSLDVSTYTLPIATATTLGGVKIGEGVSVASDGTISVSASDGEAASDDDVDDMLDTVFPEGEDSGSTDSAASDDDVEEMLDTVYSDGNE